jgi:hypothetical protein
VFSFNGSEARVLRCDRLSPRKRQVLSEEPCWWCREDFYPRNDDQKFCSLGCFDEFRAVDILTRSEKTCAKCGETKPFSDFAKHSNRADGMQSVCKACGLAYRRPGQKNSDLKRRFNITPGHYEYMLDEQDHRCQICGRRESGIANTRNAVRVLAVDHDHSCCPGTEACGKCVRGLLCTRCNIGLGYFRDDIDKMTSAIAYLIKYEKTKVPA